MRYSSRAVLLMMLGLTAGLSIAPSASASPSSTQLVVDYSDIPTLYTLDSEHGEIDKSASRTELWINRLLPWAREQHHRFPWDKTDRVYRSSSCKVSAFSLGIKRHLYAVDESRSRLCAFDQDGTSTVLWSGLPLISPHSVATLGGDVLYIADRGANAVLAFSLRTGGFIQSYWDEREVPDKIIGGNGQVVGMSYAQHTIIQLFVSEGSADSSALPVGSVFRIRRSAYDTIVEPIDFGIDGTAVYILDNTYGLIYVSLSGANVMSLRLEGITQVSHPSAIAVAHPDTLHLIFSEPERHIEVIQNIRPATIYLDQDDPEQGLLESCKYLLARQLLPTETRTYADVTAFISDLGNQGLNWNGHNHRDLVELISKLNSGKSERDLLSSTVSGIVVPSLEVVRYNAKSKVTLPVVTNNLPTSTLGDYVKSRNVSIPAANSDQATSNDAIKHTLDTLNYSYSGKDILNEVSGTYIVPVPALRFVAFVSAWVGDPAYKGAKEIERYGSIVPLGNTRVSIQAEFENDGVAGDTKGQWRDFVHMCKVDGISASYLGVVDFQIDHTHPEFSSAGKISTYLPANAPLLQQSESSAALGTFDYSTAFQAGATHPATANDHGTHVAALAAGNLSGVDRFAMIKDVSVDNFVTAARDADNPIQIYNLSLGEKYYTADEAETLRTWIDPVTDDKNGGTLFVIAAGNDHTKIVKGMLAFAGLRNNVIVVAASDTVAQPPTEWLDGDQQHGSNFGYPSVGLYAPGRDIESATFGGQYGVASGTSQATALVSGAASLLKGIDRDYKPWQIKERLISTSSLDGWIDRDHSKGGMLDISRAIHNLNKTVIRYSQETVDCVADVVTPDSDGRVEIKGDNSWKLGSVGFSDIRRIHRISSLRDDFELFISYLDPDSGDRKLYRTTIIHSGDISAPLLTIVNGTNCGSKNELDLSQIDDLYNPVPQ